MPNTTKTDAPETDHQAVPTMDITPQQQTSTDDVDTLSALLSIDNRRVPAPIPDIDTQIRLADFLPCCAPARSLWKNEQLSARLVSALSLGYDHLRRSSLTDFQSNWLSRNQEMKIFSPEMDLLNELLRAPWKEDKGFGDGMLFIDQLELRRLTGLLDGRRLTASPSFHANNAYLPSLPIWGRDTNDAFMCYSPNDFEILGACFRREVEAFLATLSRQHRFSLPTDGQSNKAHSGGGDSETMAKSRTAAHSAKNTRRVSVDNHHSSSRQAAHSPFTSQYSSTRLNSMFSKPATNTSSGSPDDGDDSDGSSDDSPDDHNHTTGNHGHGRYVAMRRNVAQPPSDALMHHEAHFDFKLKLDVVPTWNGDSDTLAHWIDRVNTISKKSPTVCQQLGTLVPQRLTDDAESWYYSLSNEERNLCEQDWESMRDMIGKFYMNRTWLEKTRRQAMKIYYRDASHPNESPSQYFIRKSKLLSLVYNYTDAKIISEIMDGAPRIWKTLLTARRYRTTRELQNDIKLHEEDLIEFAEHPAFLTRLDNRSHDDASGDGDPSELDNLQSTEPHPSGSSICANTSRVSVSRHA
ncbi:hypothetical protein EUX98_g4613 [Antrodiella citrinella]|uniref:Retrotransposon gag domain-containing protein n=1 Tax=Antrodiella citrinella TaxID=2447956 RepID=A0A4S4MTK6_9APHY|nr:hypothetical protein EUX98_g4613 [Antrodiella citrinella]